MSWKDILKNYEPTVSEVNLLASRHALIDIYETKLVSEEEYKGYSYQDKRRYHNKLFSFLKDKEDSDDANDLKPNKTFHLRMNNILRSNINKETSSRLENEPKEEVKDRSKKLFNRPKGTKGRTTRQPKRQLINTNIIDSYFEMYKNSGRGKPTLKDIEQGEERHLTVDEKEYYYTKI
tara:strand:+ start:5955 stop:6488 length:534 start_codon:yes stop_codon:yes gene_type:complete